MAKTYNDLYMDARRALRQAGIEAYNLEARLLTAYASDRSAEKLLQSLGLYAMDTTEIRLQQLLARRIAGEPVAYIIGEWEFYGLNFLVTRDVLIPRSDTETLVDTALAILRHREQEVRVLDLCCGSGCIGCALAYELPGSHITMLDISEAAVRVSRENVLRNNLSPRVTCMAMDVLQPPPPLLGTFDAITCNPPYIAAWEIPTLDASVRDYEPLSALDGGADGYDFYNSVIPGWKHLLRDNGAFILEVGEGQAQHVAGLLSQNGFIGVQSIPDTSGTPRVVFGRKDTEHIMR